MIGGHGQIGRPAGPEIGGRHNFDDAQLAQPLGMIQRKAIGDPRAAVMAQDICARNIQRGEKIGHILRHCALGIGRVAGIICRRAAFTIAAQIGNDHIMPPRQLRRHAFPAHMILRKPVDQEQRLALPSAMHREIHAVAADDCLSETFNHVQTSGCCV